jgi:hypothetical protein
MGRYDRKTLGVCLAISVAIPIVAFSTGYVAAAFVLGAFVVAIAMVLTAELRAPRRARDAEPVSPSDGGSPSRLRRLRSRQT